MKYSAIVNGELIEISFRAIGPALIEAEVGGRKYTIEAREVQPGVYWFNCQNRSLEIAVSRSGDKYAASLANARIPVEIVDARAALRRAAQHGPDGTAEIRAPMPGKVVKVLVAEGAEVEANQGLLVVEAMKMQNEIRSPKKGIVRKLKATEGAAVNAGDILANVE